VSKTILVTGASRGIGRAASLAGALGWSVGVGYRENRAAADAVVAAIVEPGARAVAVQADLAHEADVIRMFDETERELGALDGAVVNAGIVAPPSPFVEMSAARLRRIFDMNLLGAFLCAREAADGSPGAPADTAEGREAIAWVLSDAASYSTGAVLDVSSGR
jgi:NAD(P)-dependent dehydrogenase (short-subunit alcohol dehydrogenase family)